MLRGDSLAVIGCKISAVLAIASTFLYNPPEMGKEQHQDKSFSFLETYMFDEKPGAELQIRMAKVLVDIIREERPLTRDDFLVLDRTLNRTQAYLNDPNADTQEGLVLNAMTRFFNILGLVAAEGNQNAAAELLGSSEHYQELPELTGRIREITKPPAPLRPSVSEPKSIYQQWRAWGSPVTRPQKPPRP